MKLIQSLALRTAVALGIAASLVSCQSGGSRSSIANSEGTFPSIGARAALRSLTSSNPGAAALAEKAKGVLVFPEVVKGGFIVGGFHGEGRMIQNGQITGAYETGGLSYGIQAGLQEFAYALFFMSDEDMRYLDSSSGWELGTAPNITIIDSGTAGSLSTTTARKGVYCFFFDQKGLMAGIGLQGSKITRVDR